MNSKFLWTLLFFILTVWAIFFSSVNAWIATAVAVCLGFSISDWEKTGFKIFNK